MYRRISIRSMKDPKLLVRVRCTTRKFYLHKPPPGRNDWRLGLVSARGLNQENIREKKWTCNRSLPTSNKQSRERPQAETFVKVMREDDPDGKWNYEVFVKANGKESGFEIDPKGNFVKEHSE